MLLITKCGLTIIRYQIVRSPSLCVLMLSFQTQNLPLEFYTHALKYLAYVQLETAVPVSHNRSNSPLILA